MEIPERPFEDLSQVPHIPVNPDDFTTIIHDYSAPKPYHDPEVDSIMDKLSFADKATICIGAGMVLPEFVLQDILAFIQTAR